MVTSSSKGSRSSPSTTGRSGSDRTIAIDRPIVWLRGVCVFDMLSKDELSEREAALVAETGELLVRLAHERDGAACRRELCNLLDLLTPSLPIGVIERMPNENLIHILRWWAKLPGAEMPPAVGSA